MASSGDKIWKKERGGRGLRIVVRAADARARRRTEAQLAAAGVEAEAFDIDLIHPRGEDVAVVAAGSGRETLRIARRIAQRPGPPVAIVAATDRRAPPRPGLAPLGPVDLWAALDGPPDLMARQIASAGRSGVAREELRLRRQTAAEHGLRAPPAGRAQRVKALYIGAPSPFFLALERAFAAQRGLVRAAFSSFSGFDHLHDEHFDAVALNGAADPATALALCTALRRNGAFHHVPTLVITRSRDSRTQASAIDRGAAAVLAEDEPSEVGVGWLFDAIRCERRRCAVERELRTLRERLGDPATGLIHADTFCAHLARQADDHHATGRPLSLLALRVAPGRADEAAWRKGFREIAGLATELVRAADCCAALDWNLIGAAFPATALAGARRAAERIASVVECASFTTGEGEPPRYVQTTAELKKGESGHALMARALAHLSQQGCVA
jgi:two-component system cell cycle response regulator PopA